MNTTRAFRLASAFAALCLTSALAAQTAPQSQEKTFYRSYGSGNFTGNVYGSTGAQSYAAPAVTLLGLTVSPSRLPGATRDPQVSFAESKLIGRVGVFGRAFEAAAVEAHSVTSDGFELKVNGNTVKTVDPQKVGTIQVRIAGSERLRMSAVDERSWNKSFGPYNVTRTPIRVNFWVGPIPITVAGNVAASAKVELSTSLDAARLEAGVEGKARAVGNGWVSAGTGGSYFGIRASTGIRAILDFADSTCDAEASVDLAGLRGAITLAIQPIRFYLRLYAKVSSRWINLSWGRTIYNWSSAVWSMTRGFELKF